MLDFALWDKIYKGLNTVSKNVITILVHLYYYYFTTITIGKLWNNGQI